jgi:hypothetical protein
LHGIRWRFRSVIERIGGCRYGSLGCSSCEVSGYLQRRSGLIPTVGHEGSMGAQ